MYQAKINWGRRVDNFVWHQVHLMQIAATPDMTWD